MPVKARVRRARPGEVRVSLPQGSWLYPLPVTLRAAYRRIADEIAAQIVAGEVPVGSRLPSKRQMAAERGVSVGTIEKAVEVLAGWGLVETAQGVGASVTSDRPEIKLTVEQRLDRIERHLGIG